MERIIPMSNEIYRLLKRIRINKSIPCVFLNSADRKYTLHGLETNFRRLVNF